MDLRVYQALDDETLAALASRGLLRRAQKDLEREPPALVERADDRLILAFAADECRVTMPPTGPQGASCSCPAEGACRHILAAALFLRDHLAERADATQAAGDEATPAHLPSPLAPPPSLHGPRPTPHTPRDEIMALGEDELRAWATRAVYRQALDDLAGDPEVVVEAGERAVVVRFPQRNVVARWLAGAGLAGMLCSCKRAEPCRHRVAALLVYRARHGKPLPAAERAALQAATGTPRSREEVLAAVEATLVELVALGFGRLSPATEGRLRTLAISAHGVDLPRLARALRALGDQVAWHVNRDVRADAAQLLAAAARLDALVAALRQAGAAPPAALVGEHRSRYYDVGGLELVGLGAQQWRTRSGYAGLTVYFWDTAARRWASWSASRPIFGTDGRFDPQQVYRQGATWEDAPPAMVVSRSRLRLGNARRNREGRLSAHAGCQAFVTGRADPLALDLSPVRHDDWAVLARHAREVAPAGLAERAPLDSLVVVAPARWGDAHYDQLRQRLVRPVYDGDGRALALVLPHAPAWPFAVDTLQAWRPDESDTWGVLGFVRLTAEGLALAPLSLLNRAALPDPIASPTLHLTLDPWRPSGAAAATPPATETTEPAEPDPEVPPPVAADEPEEEPPPDDDAAAASDTAVGRLLAAAAVAVERVAERGVGVAQAAAEEELHGLAERLRQFGLTVCADALAALAARLADRRHRATPDHRPSARAVLRAAYILDLATEQLLVADGFRRIA